MRAPKIDSTRMSWAEQQPCHILFVGVGPITTPSCGLTAAKSGLDERE